MNIRKLCLISAALTLSLSFFIFYVGYFRSYIDHDEHIVYFIKKFPTLRREFINPFANEGDPSPIDELAPNARKDLVDYCKFAYGVTHYDQNSLADCRVRAIREVD
jgi:hypothetical protein